MFRTQRLREGEFRITPGQAEPEDPIVVEFLEYWLSMLENGHLPKRSRIDPLAIPRCLPHVWIYTRVENSMIYRCELAGESINTAWGMNIKGHTSDKLFGSEANEIVTSRWRYLTETGVYAYSNFHGGRHSKSSERVSVPVTDDDGQINTIFGITLYDYRPEMEFRKTIDVHTAGFLYFDPRDRD